MAINGSGMQSQSERSLQNQARFDEAAKNYASPQLSFFDRLGERLINELSVSEGASVLDIGCGTGAITIPASQTVGSNGRVVGTDISSGMLDVAKRRSHELGHTWTSYIEGDLASLELEPDFDFGTCGFVMQMFNDLTTVPKALARQIKSGGKIGLSVWAKGSWEPHNTVFSQVMGTIKPQPKPVLGNIDKLQEPGVVESLMAESGFRNVQVERAALPHRLGDFDEYWNLCTTLGARVALEKLSDSERAEVRRSLQSAIGNVAASDGSITLCMDAMFLFGEVL